MKAELFVAGIHKDTVEVCLHWSRMDGGLQGLGSAFACWGWDFRSRKSSVCLDSCRDSWMFSKLSPTRHRAVSAGKSITCRCLPQVLAHGRDGWEDVEN